MNPIPTQIYTIPTQIYTIPTPNPTPNPIPLHMIPNPDSSCDSGFEIAPGLNVRSCEVIKLFVFFFRQNHDARFQAIMKQLWNNLWFGVGCRCCRAIHQKWTCESVINERTSFIMLLNVFCSINCWTVFFLVRVYFINYHVIDVWLCVIVLNNLSGWCTGPLTSTYHRIDRSDVGPMFVAIIGSLPTSENGWTSTVTRRQPAVSLYGQFFTGPLMVVVSRQRLPTAGRCQLT